MAKNSFYAVSKGRKPGIYTSWDAAKAQVTGFSGAAHKGFKTEMEAMNWLHEQGTQWSEQPGSAAPMPPPASASGRLPADEIEALIEQDQQHLEEEALYEQQQQQQAAHYYRNQQSEATTAFLERQQQQQRQHQQQQQQQQWQPQPASIGRRMRMEFDGASKSNPGPAGFGCVIFDEASGVELTRMAQYMGPFHTNNQAEWAGLLAGMAAALQLGCQDLKVQGDSKLVIQQLLGAYKVKAEGLIPYWQLGLRLKGKFARFDAVHVPRELNAVADALSNQGIANASQQARPWTLDEFEEACAPLIGRKAGTEAEGHFTKRRRMTLTSGE